MDCVLKVPYVQDIVMYMCHDDINTSIDNVTVGDIITITIHDATVGDEPLKDW